MTPTVDLQGAAQLMHVHPKTVEDLIRDGVLPAAKIGRKYVMNTADVMAHIEREIVRQTAARMRKPLKPLARAA